MLLDKAFALIEGHPACDGVSEKSQAWTARRILTLSGQREDPHSHLQHVSIVLSLVIPTRERREQGEICISVVRHRSSATQLAAFAAIRNTSLVRFDPGLTTSY